jgi:hypothetical protein
LPRAHRPSLFILDTPSSFGAWSLGCLPISSPKSERSLNKLASLGVDQRKGGLRQIVELTRAHTHSFSHTLTHPAHLHAPTHGLTHVRRASVSRRFRAPLRTRRELRATLSVFLLPGESASPWQPSHTHTHTHAHAHTHTHTHTDTLSLTHTRAHGALFVPKIMAVCLRDGNVRDLRLR